MNKKKQNERMLNNFKLQLKAERKRNWKSKQLVRTKKWTKWKKRWRNKGVILSYGVFAELTSDCVFDFIRHAICFSKILLISEADEMKA